ncbi:MAG: hypothetical protein Q4F49_02130 [Pseudoxanthomonas suwonensis]|nr:hypothetical protein [Pseudoxanthomonas suwonensis]MDO5505079.1 hypothetical protein [Pseudoxanthomonas suwonensis]
MKPLASLLFFGALLAVSGGCHSTEPEKPDFSCDGELSCGQLEELTESALNGSANAALDLFWASLDKGEKEEALYWAQIAMENGSAAGRRNYASLLSEKGDAKSLARARYHLRMLVSQGYEGADVLLGAVERKLAESP